jgi:hypothetical protein
MYSIIKRMSRALIAVDDGDQYAGFSTGLTKLLLAERIEHEILG